MMPNQVVNVNVAQQMPLQQIGKQQYGSFVRLLYFVFIGWWLGFGLDQCCTVFLCDDDRANPSGIAMFTFLPAILTLQQ